ncbi:MAG: carboxypeptidase-like regulatory domain-containing protein [Planctomycetia bacterium]|nr:carboxypeptidase-like regulatory domain-containing protein [Planctomycetia bacterium]
MNPSLSLARLSAALLLAGVVGFAGCARPVGDVSGKVTYNGKPLKGGSVTFISDEGRHSVSASINEDGTYKVPTLTGGTYKVCVDTSYLKPAPNGPGGYVGSGGKSAPPPATKGPPPKSAPPPDAVVPEGYKPSNPAEAQAAANAKKYVQIPDQYKEPDKTTLSYKFEGGSQTYDIDLK